MSNNARVKFGISVDHYHKDMWSLGVALSHDYEETYLWINLIKWTIAIGFCGGETMNLIDKDFLLGCLFSQQMSYAESDRPKVDEYDLWEKAIKLVEGIPTIESSGWVDVKERLPKPGRPVFGLGTDGTIKAVRSIGYGIFLNSINSRVEQITHWMQPHNPPEVKK